jgi:hypothetical protein
MMLVSVIIPTVEGREDHFNRCVNAYLDRTVNSVQIIVESNHASCGLAWQAGLRHVAGDYAHLTCDDIEPLQDWDVPAIEAVDAGFLPAPQVCDVNGYPQSHPQVGVLGEDWAPVRMSALPFASAAQMEKIAPLLTCHYYSDDWISWRGARAGWPCRLRSGYRFTHHWAQHRRGAGMSEADRMTYDKALYEQAQEMAEAGEWTEPWPPAGI